MSLVPLVLVLTLLQAPDPHAAQPERPSVATHARTVAPGWLELEMGVERERGDSAFQGASIPLVAKIGLARQFQLNLSTSPAKADGRFAAGNTGLSLKWRFRDRVKAVGALAVLSSLTFPRGTDADSGAPIPPAFGLVAIASRTFGEIGLDVNLGWTRHGGDGSTTPKVDTVWAASFSGPIAGAVGWGAEIHGFPRTHGAAGAASSVGLLVGPTFTARPWLTFDAGFVTPIAGPEARKIYFGGVWNAGRLWR